MTDPASPSEDNRTVVCTITITPNPPGPPSISTSPNPITLTKSGAWTIQWQFSAATTGYRFGDAVGNVQVLLPITAQFRDGNVSSDGRSCSVKDNNKNADTYAYYVQIVTAQGQAIRHDPSIRNGTR